MKKFLFILVSFLALSSIWSVTFACIDIDFYNDSVCVYIDKNNDTQYELYVDHCDYSYYPSNAYYYVLLPNYKGGILSPRLQGSSMRFNYDHTDYDYNSDIRKVKVYAVINNVVKSTEAYYDFDNWNREDEWSSSSSSNWDLDNFYITLSDSTPARNDEVTLNIKARDWSSTLSNYYWSNAEITIEYRTSSSSSRRTATSSYVSIDDKTPNFYNGIAKTDITFKYEYEYRITVTDDDENVDDYKIFDVDSSSSSSSNWDTDNFYISTDDSTPDTNQRVDLTIRARDWTYTDTSYNNAVNFEVYYRTSSSNSRTKTTSSYYYEISSNYKNWYNFSSSNNWQKTITNFIRFKKNYEYKVLVIDKDDEDIDWYITFDIRNTDSNTDWFTVRELEYVKTMYNWRTKLVSSFKSNYSNLRNDEDRVDMANEIYDNMKDVIDDNNNREYDKYNDYYDAIMDRYTYTIDNRY